MDEERAAATPVEPVASRRWVSLAMAFLSTFSSSVVILVLAPLAPLFQPELGLSKSEVGLFISATNAGQWGALLVAGFLTDRFGIRGTMSLGMAVTGGLLMLMASVASVVQAAVVMFATGISRGAISPGATKAVYDWFPLGSRATAMSIKQLGLPIAGLIVAGSIPALGLALGWRLAVALPGLFILAGGILVAVLYRDPHPRDRSAAPKVRARAAFGEVARNRTMWLLAAVAFPFLVVQLAFTSYVVLYFDEIVLKTAMPDAPSRLVAAGGFLAVCQAGGASGRLFWGMVSDRLLHGRRGIVLVVLAMSSAAISVLLAFLNGSHPMWLFTFLVFAFGATAVGWNGVYYAMLAEAVGRKYAGTGVGLAMSVTEGGTVLGPPLFGLMVDLDASYQTAWLFLGSVAIVATILAVAAARGEVHRVGDGE